MRISIYQSTVNFSEDEIGKLPTKRVRENAKSKFKKYIFVRISKLLRTWPTQCTEVLSTSAFEFEEAYVFYIILHIIFSLVH